MEDGVGEGGALFTSSRPSSSWYACVAFVVSAVVQYNLLVAFFEKVKVHGQSGKHKFTLPAGYTVDRVKVTGLLQLPSNLTISSIHSVLSLHKFPNYRTKKPANSH